MVVYADKCFFTSFNDVTEWRNRNVNLEAILITVELDDIHIEMKAGADVSAAEKELGLIMERDITINSGIDEFLGDLVFTNLEDYDKFIEEFTSIANRHFENFGAIDITVLFKSGTAEKYDEGDTFDESHVFESLSSVSEIDKILKKLGPREKDFISAEIEIDCTDFNIKEEYTKEDVEKAITEFYEQPITLQDYENRRVKNAFIPLGSVRDLYFDDVDAFKASLKKFKSIAETYFKRFDDFDIEIFFR